MHCSRSRLSQPPTPPTTAKPPSPPTDFRFTATTPTSVTLSWTAAVRGTSPVAAHVVNHTRTFNDIYYSQTIGNVTTVTITSNIQPVSQYTFWLLALDADNRNSLSPPPVSAVAPASAIGDTTPPATPGNLRITGTTSTGPTLAWDASTDNVGVTGYNVYFFDGWFTSTLLGTTTGTTFAAPVMSGVASPGYYMRAEDAAGNVSIASNLVPPGTTTTPTPTPPPARICKLAYRTTSEWAGGFVAELTITNTAPAAVNGWTLAFPTAGGQRMTSSWNATFTQTGPDVTLTAARWNRTLAPARPSPPASWVAGPAPTPHPCRPP